MKVSQKQIQVMYQVLVDSLCIVGASSPFKFDRDTREKYADEILNQQSDEIHETEPCEHERDEVHSMRIAEMQEFRRNKGWALESYRELCTKCGEFYK